MICIVNENNQIINITNGNAPRESNERICYEWNTLWNQYTAEMPLEYAKNIKIKEIKDTRDVLEVEPIEYNGNNFDYDEKARDRINAAIIALDMQSAMSGSEAILSWTTADNTEATVTANDLRGIIANVALRSNELHIRYRELKDLVELATTEEELEAIKWGVEE